MRNLTPKLNNSLCDKLTDALINGQHVRMRIINDEHGTVHDDDYYSRERLYDWSVGEEIDYNDNEYELTRQAIIADAGIMSGQVSTVQINLNNDGWTNLTV